MWASGYIGPAFSCAFLRGASSSLMVFVFWFVWFVAVLVQALYTQGGAGSGDGGAERMGSGSNWRGRGNVGEQVSSDMEGLCTFLYSAVCKGLRVIGFTHSGLGGVNFKHQGIILHLASCWFVISSWEEAASLPRG